MRRSPCEVYIKYLILAEHNYTNADIKGILESLELDFVSDMYVTRLRGLFTDRPEQFRPRDRTHATSYKYIAKHGLLSVFHPDEDTTAAFEILDHSKAKSTLEGLFINRMPPFLIAAKLEKQGVTISPGALLRYRYLFWQTDNIDTIAMKTLLRARYKDLPKSDLYLDPRWVAVMSGQSPISSMITQVAAGIMPYTVDMKELMRRNHHMAALRLGQELEQGGMGYDQRAANLSHTVRALEEFKDKYDRPEENLLNSMNKVQVQQDYRVLPMIRELSGGSHTTELNKDPAPIVEDGEGPNATTQVEEEDADESVE